MGFNAKTGRKALCRKGGLHSWTVRLQLHGIEYYRARMRLMQEVYRQNRLINRETHGSLETDVESLVPRETDLPE